jgi:hypothetical protein
MKTTSIKGIIAGNSITAEINTSKKKTLTPHTCNVEGRISIPVTPKYK